jgi:predicted DCC family thiol-disulfide oxidoreductase YuxK
MTQTQDKPTVLYDGACPLCVREIAFYRNKRGAERLEWRDISTASDGAQVCGVDAASAKARFHVVMPDGTPRVGAAGFIEIWKALRAFRWLGRLTDNAPIRWLLDRGYDLFLRVRPRLQRFVARRV